MQLMSLFTRKMHDCRTLVTQETHTHTKRCFAFPDVVLSLFAYSNMGGCCQVSLNPGAEIWPWTSYYSQQLPTWVDIEQSLFDSQALQYHCFIVFPLKSNKKKVRFTALPTKSHYPVAPPKKKHTPKIAPVLPRSRWDNNVAVPMCGPWWRCHGSSYCWTLGESHESYFPWVRDGSMKQKPNCGNSSESSTKKKLKSESPIVILHSSILWSTCMSSLGLTATIVWPRL